MAERESSPEYQALYELSERLQECNTRELPDGYGLILVVFDRPGGHIVYGSNRDPITSAMAMVEAMRKQGMNMVAVRLPMDPPPHPGGDGPGLH